MERIILWAIGIACLAISFYGLFCYMPSKGSRKEEETEDENTN